MKKKIIILMTITLTLCPLTILFAATFSDLYVFGDSLSDSGQFIDFFAGHPTLRATNRVDPLDPSSETARVWSQYFSLNLGLGELLPSTPLSGGPSGNNYAVMGLRSDEILASITEPNGSVVLSNTRDGYLIEYPHADPHALYVVWGGGNDLRDLRDARAGGGSEASLLDDAQATADNIVAGVEALSSAGARYILVPNLPSIGEIPESNFLGPGYVNAGNEATTAFNDWLLERLNTSGVNVIQTDVRSLFAEILNAPAIFGFSDEDHRVFAFDSAAFTTVPAAEGLNGANSPSPDPSKYVFFDGIHPTTYAANILAMYFQSIIEAPGQTSILAEVPLHLVRGHANGIENHLRAMHRFAQRGKYVPFISGGYSYLDVDDTDEAPGYDNRHYGLSVGLSYCLTDRFIAGLALGHNAMAVDFDDDRGSFDLDGMFLSLLAGYRYGNFILDAVATGGDLDYDDIDRKIRLGPALRTHEGDTGGSYYGVKISLELDLLHKKGLSIGPLAAINYQETDVDGYCEKGSLSTSMKFQDQERKSLLGSVGMFFTYDTRFPFGSMQFYGHMAYEEEFKDDDRFVHARVNTLKGSYFRLPAYEPETGFWNLDLGAHTRLSDDWVGAISYYLQKGDDVTFEQGINLTFQFLF